jgi:hypothetical protein
MDRNSNYYRQVQLLTSALPYVARETCFALKGGTAINLFHLPMPRLSVDCTSSEHMAPLEPFSKRHFSARTFSSLAC